MDPIAADGMLFYKGFFLVLLGIRAMIGDDRWSEPFEMIRDGEYTFTWSHAAIAALLNRRDVRGPAIALALSREWRISDLEARLSRAIDAQFEPTWDHDRGEFTWGLGLGEEHPRGQYNAFLATAEAASPGAWTRLSAAPLEACPQVVGVDFPNVALSRALWVNGVLHLRLDVHRPDPARLTTFRILDAEPGRAWSVVGAERSMIERDVSALVVTTPMRSGDLRIEPLAV
jgi:hypothetical protein